MSDYQTKEDRALEAARGSLEVIREMVAELEAAREREENPPEEEDPKALSVEDAERRIHEDPLSVEYRSGWYSLSAGDEAREPEEVRVLLSTGGPASRIVASLDRSRVSVEGQDWFTPWVSVPLNRVEEADLWTYLDTLGVLEV